jgi:peptidoglycan hydrolase-like protein with peptidoglycan-binding domain
METLAYLHLALATETSLQVCRSERLERRKSSHRAALYLMPMIIALGVLGMASQTLAETIGQGATGSEVTVIQERLQRLGYFNQSPTGVFGSVTKNAVIQFQQENGIPTDGVVGEQTMRVLFSPGARGIRVQNYGFPSGQRSQRFGASRQDYGIPSVEESRRFRTSRQDYNAPFVQESRRFSASGGSNVLQLGDRGSQVRRLQEKLSDRGFNPGLIDGVYGGQTQNAVREFQLQNELFADGVAGKATLVALGIRAEAEQVNPYVVVVPFQNENTLEAVRAVVGFRNATLAEAKQGRYINAGAFESRATAERRSLLLRSRGLDARVTYFR